MYSIIFGTVSCRPVCLGDECYINFISIQEHLKFFKSIVDQHSVLIIRSIDSIISCILNDNHYFFFQLTYTIYRTRFSRYILFNLIQGFQLAETIYNVTDLFSDESQRDMSIPAKQWHSCASAKSVVRVGPKVWGTPLG